MLILQGFYWDCPSDWYNELSFLTGAIAEKGFTDIWLPPPSRGMAGDDSMGYDIKDHYNLDSKFGTKEELVDLIDKFHYEGVDVMADLVMGHMLGGKKEYNPSLDKDTYTKFDSSLFQKDYKHFCRDCGGCNTRSSFGETICYYNDDEYMKEGLIEWAAWLKDIGFDKFRLDNLKEMRWDFVKEFFDSFNNYMVGEYWSGNDVLLEALTDYIDLALFNFPLFYKMKEMCMNPEYPMYKLTPNPNRVNFVSNHDVERSEPIINNKELAYAYILFQKEPAVVFWEDYFEYKLKDKIDELIKPRKYFAEEYPVVAHTDNDLYVAERGNYTLYINNSLDERTFNEVTVEGQSYKLEVN
jgi:alpha-amylase